MTPGTLVDVATSRDGHRSLYRVIGPLALAHPAWATMRRYNPARRTFGPPRPVQVDRVVRVYTKSNCPLDLPNKARRYRG